ncbi:MAG: S24/S26 family peptidase [bacterium]
MVNCSVENIATCHSREQSESGIQKDGFCSHSTLPENGSSFIPPTCQHSLVLVSLDIGRALADRGSLTLRVKGTCMYPTIRPGDVLRVRSRAAADIAVGDIAVYRKSKLLFSHRVIETGQEDGRPYIATRPDGALDGNDGRTFDENLLGVVTAIERKGKPMPLQKANHPWLLRRYFDLCVALIKASKEALLWLNKMLARVQDGALYRWSAKTCLTLAKPRISFAVRLPMPALGEAVYRQLSPETFNVEMDWRGKPVTRWTLTLHLNGASQPAAWAKFARDETEKWHEEEIFVRGRYRGAGLDETLRRQSDKILLRQS